MHALDRGVLALSVTWLLAACGGGDLPAKQLADTQASIRAAQEVGAEETPQAALQLKIARDGLTRAHHLTQEGEGDQARSVLQEAELDAELAVLLARQETSEAKALEAKARVDALGAAKQDVKQDVRNERSMP